METKDNLHNLHLEKTKFYSPKWSRKKLQARQITFDTKDCPDCFFLVNEKTLELIIYFDSFG